jgi:protoheme IX farnesyltransferase
VSTAVRARPAGGVLALASRVADYVALTKPRIVSLLLFTGACGLFAGARGHPSVGQLLAVLGGGALSAGGANALNCALDRDLDALMARTRRRPVPSGRLPAANAVVFGLLLNVVAAAWLAAAANLLAAALALAGTAWYVLVYTWWLKRRSAQNIVIGGLAGSFPPLVGWAAATGRIDATALVLAAVVFLWTPPHFWALATLLREDYRRAGVPMLPVVVSPEATATQMLGYAAATVAVSLMPIAWHGFGVLYLAAAGALGAGLLVRVGAFRRYPDRLEAGKVFRYSLIYLPGLFVAAVIGRIVAS